MSVDQDQHIRAAENAETDTQLYQAAVGAIDAYDTESGSWVRAIPPLVAHALLERYNNLSGYRYPTDYKGPQNYSGLVVNGMTLYPFCNAVLYWDGTIQRGDVGEPEWHAQERIVSSAYNWDATKEL